MSSTKEAALYVRVSTDAQTVENQIRGAGSNREQGSSLISTANPALDLRTG
jgi:DNA invertase Pin-like site-specific DNA recombinase